MNRDSEVVSKLASERGRTVIRIALLCLSTVVALGIAEIALALVAPVEDPFEAIKHPSPNSFIRSQRQPSDTYQIRVVDALPGIPRTATYGTNNVGYRGPPLLMPKPEGEYRIIMVGASTTENPLLDDSLTLSAVMQRELRARTGDGRIRVYSAGVAGHRSDDHVAMVGHRIAHQDPDLIVVFAGINDLLAAMQDLDYQHFGADRSPRTDLTFYTMLKMMSTEWQLPRRLVYLSRNFRGDAGLRSQGVATTDYAAAVATMHAAPTATERPRTDLLSFIENIQSIVGMARAHGWDVALMTQFTTWNSTTDPATDEWQWLRLANGVVYPEEWMDEAMEQYNDGLRTLASEADVPLLDLSAMLEKSSRYAFDDVHFTAEGSDVAGTALAELLVDRVMNARGR
jgi:lysophospholipase L1-like esterase